MEASQAPGACVRELAQQHGVCVSLIYRWRRSAALRPRPSRPRYPNMDAPISNGAMAPEGPLEFVPLGVFGQAEDAGPALITGPAVGRADASAPGPSSGAAMQARPGLIEIDLPDGTRLRVDAFVNERALRRVLAVLKATA